MLTITQNAYRHHECLINISSMLNEELQEAKVEFEK